ncbi:MAG: hypothetical protein HC778_02700 [Chamaesiphon sp. CSU_1_12]|nr:hypothetical protein [Chamaesiphon sp. CSU_1_12]
MRAERMRHDGRAVVGAQVDLAYNSLAFQAACEAILDLVRSSNKYIDDLAPWTLFKQERHTELAQVLYSVLESARLAAYLLSPIVPKISTDIYRQLGLEIDFDLICGRHSTVNIDRFNLPSDWEHHRDWGILRADTLLGEAKPIFTKLDLPS